MADYSLNPSYPGWDSRSVFVVRNPHNLKVENGIFSVDCRDWTGLGVGTSPYLLNSGETFLIFSVYESLSPSSGTGSFSRSISPQGKLSSILGYHSVSYTGGEEIACQYIIKESSDNYVTNYGSGLVDVTDANFDKCIFCFVRSTPTPVTVDLSTLSGWSNVTAGSHTLQIKAKANGYRDSELSQGVSFTKAGAGNALTLNFIARNYVGDGANDLCIKLNGTPTDADDYDYYLHTPYAGSYGWFTYKDDVSQDPLVNIGYDGGGTYTIYGVNSVTYWISEPSSDFIGVNSDTTSAPTFASKVTQAISTDTTMSVYYDYDT